MERSGDLKKSGESSKLREGGGGGEEVGEEVEREGEEGRRNEKPEKEDET